MERQGLEAGDGEMDGGWRGKRSERSLMASFSSPCSGENSRNKSCIWPGAYARSLPHTPHRQVLSALLPKFTLNVHSLQLFHQLSPGQHPGGNQQALLLVFSPVSRMEPYSQLIWLCLAIPGNVPAASPPLRWHSLSSAWAAWHWMTPPLSSPKGPASLPLLLGVCSPHISRASVSQAQ